MYAMQRMIFISRNALLWMVYFNIQQFLYFLILNYCYPKTIIKCQVCFYLYNHSFVTINTTIVLSNKLLSALEDIGCIYLINHGIHEKVINSLFVGIHKFFAYNDTFKKQIAINEHQIGWLKSVSAPTMDNEYISISTMKYTKKHDLKEVLFFGPEKNNNLQITKISNATKMIGKNVWPTFLPHFYSLYIEKYYEQVLKIGQNILRIIAHGLDLPSNFFDKYYNINNFSLGRGQLLFYEYPNFTKNIKSVDELINEYKYHTYSVGPHTDFGVLTLLLLDKNSNGLQFYPRSKMIKIEDTNENANGSEFDENEWIDVPFLENSLIVNIGDLLAQWTNYRLQPTIHRVINKYRVPGKHRYGCAIFHDPSASAIIDHKDMLREWSMNESEDEIITEKRIYVGEYIDSRNRKSFGHYSTNKCLNENE